MRMHTDVPISNSTLAALARREPVLWMNPKRRRAEGRRDVPFGGWDVAAAEARWIRFEPLLQRLFPELCETEGRIESPLCSADALAEHVLPGGGGRLFIKADHALPVAGSIKARGGLYAVLHFAESVAFECGLLNSETDGYAVLADPPARAIFSDYTLSVASTGNLGLSIGIAGAALGFQVVVHMSAEAKAWKKERLRARGVRVVEHAADYTEACARARDEAGEDRRCFFIDDENSAELFLGYACAVSGLQRQLRAAGVDVDAGHPLFLYLPCGVGGAPGGIAFAADRVWGAHVHAIAVEPVEKPCLLLGMLTGRHDGIAVYDIGLGGPTDADGLAVSRPSRFIGPIMDAVLSGCATVEDQTLYRYVLAVFETLGFEIEPSAAAGFSVPRMLIETGSGKTFLDDRGVRDLWSCATHVVWTTGGSFVPPEQHERFRARARSESFYQK